jgi:hypothetical protein
MWTPAEGPLPWAASGQKRSSRASTTIAGIALPDPETAILASSDAALWIVPLRAPQAQLAALKPMRLQGIHGDIKAITFSHRTEQLVVAGQDRRAVHNRLQQQSANRPAPSFSQSICFRLLDSLSMHAQALVVQARGAPACVCPCGPGLTGASSWSSSMGAPWWEGTRGGAE